MNASSSETPKLKSGFTTGAAAAAAVKGALRFLIKGSAPAAVTIRFLTGETTAISVHSCEKLDSDTARCTIIKDAGDDPDVTHKAEIGAVVRLLKDGAPGEILFTGGKGVGRVTKPGLEVPPGEPAINAGPRKMIQEAVLESIEDSDHTGSVAVEIFVPKGEELAKKTLNHRLGIIGGISILGTTGIVRPMSHAAYIATIESSLSVARAMGITEVVFSTGRRSERLAQTQWPHLPEETFVQIGDFFRASLRAAGRSGIEKVTLAVFFGKAVKMAQKIPHTHAATSELTLDNLSRWVERLAGDKPFADAVRAANTARHAFDIMMERDPKGDTGIIDQVGREMVGAGAEFAGPGIQVRGVIFGYNGEILFDSTSDR